MTGDETVGIAIEYVDLAHVRPGPGRPAPGRLTRAGRSG
jgi:hypothetical protein